MALNIPFIDSSRDDLHSRLELLRAQLSPQGDVVSERGRQKTIEVFGAPLSPVEVVDRICRDVQTRGLPAVLEYTERLDGVVLSAETIAVEPHRLASAHRAADSEFLATVRRVRDNILEFQRAALAQPARVERADGVVLEQRYTPLARAGVCVPGGAAAYPSTVLMTAVPAIAAGVDQIAVVAPPTSFGAENNDVLATCHELGIREVYRIGGAQGVAALAMGVQGLPAVDKIVGPGNLFVALAKKWVYGQCDIDSIAGPSEVVVIADDSIPPEFLAADLLAQAEHAPGASLLITWSRDVIEATRSALERQSAGLARSEMAIDSLEKFGALILVSGPDEACRVAESLAPEHLQISTRDARDLSTRIRSAGATFLGTYSPVAVGDYVAGPSHVLPTSGTARWATGLNANHFLRGSSVITYTRQGLERVAGDVRHMADKEGLSAHRASVDIRLKKRDT